jgi:hypothetical protein
MGMTFTGGMTLTGGMQGLSSDAPPPTELTWETNNLQAGLTLSNNNKTVTRNTAGYATIAVDFSSTGIAQGQKAMYSVTMNVYDGQSGYSAVGLVYQDGSVDNFFLGNNGESIGLFTDGNVYNNNGVRNTIQGFTTNGDVIDLAVDRVNNRYYWRVNNGDWNNDPSANPATNTGGLGGDPGYSSDLENKSELLLAVTVNNNTDAGQFTINNTSPYSVPAGFTFLG